MRCAVLTGLIAVAGAQRWYEPPIPTGYEYLLKMTPRRNRNNAGTQCTRDGGFGTHLATVPDQATNDFLFALNPVTSEKRWIGVRRTGSVCETEGLPWEWDDGTAWDDNNAVWFTGEPSNHNCAEKCVMQGSSQNNPLPLGGWNDAKCNSKAGYVCQRPIIEAVHEQQTLTFDADCNSGVSADALQSLLLGNADVQLGCGIAANENMAVTVTADFGAGANQYDVVVAAREPGAESRVYRGLTERMASCMAAVVSVTQGTCSTEAADTVAATCSDGFQNGDETGIDCGGSCPVTAAECGSANQAQGGSGGDPHFVVKLPNAGNLCFDVHGAPGQYLNLMSNADLMVNSLVVKAPASVDGTYHGAIGAVTLSPNHDELDRLVVLADGTVQFNQKTMMVRANMNGTTNFVGVSMKVAVSVSKVEIATKNGAVAFSVRFVDDKRDRAHLDFSIVTYPADPNGATHGLIGQFLSARSNVMPIDDKRSLLSVNGKSVEVLQRPVPQITAGNSKATCYKYFDSQAEGLIAGHVDDYITTGIFNAPKTFNLFKHNATRSTGRVGDYVDQIARHELALVSSVDSVAKGMLRKLDVAFGDAATTDELRNSLIAVAAKRAAMSVEELQALSTSKILQVLDVAL